MTKFDLVILFCSKQTGDPCQSFPQWPAPQVVGGGAVIVIQCTYSVEVFDGRGTEILNTISSAVARMEERSVLTVDMN